LKELNYVLVSRLNGAGYNYYYYHHHHYHYHHNHHFSHWYVDCNTETNRFSDNIFRSNCIRNTHISTLAHSTIVVVKRFHIKAGKIFLKPTAEMFAFYLRSSIENQNFVSHKTKYVPYKSKLYFLYVMKC